MTIYLCNFSQITYIHSLNFSLSLFFFGACGHRKFPGQDLTLTTAVAWAAAVIVPGPQPAEPSGNSQNSHLLNEN